MKKALIMYWHGLGDVIQLTPHMRYLYNKGYIIDLMCREEVETSHLLDTCPYINKLIFVENPWQSKIGFDPQKQININMFNAIKQKYDWSAHSVHDGIGANFKIDYTSKQLGLPIENKKLEVFITPEIEQKALEYIKNNYPDGYIFTHTLIENHPIHTWNPLQWIKDNLPKFNIVTNKKFDEDINFSFVIAREARHRILSSSVLVHACDAMQCIIDVINYGRSDRKVWLIDQNRVLHIKEEKRWLK